MPSLFSRLCSRRPRDEGLAREDFFTELWAFVLERHPPLLRAVLERVGATALLDGSELKLDTQAEYDPPAALAGSALRCIPDLRIESDGGVVFFEHKIDADQHVEELPDGVRYSQLERYLALESGSHLVYVTQRRSSVVTSVLDSSRYLRPASRDHYYWRDFYPDVVATAAAEPDPILDELCTFMRDLGMAPSQDGAGVIPSANVAGVARDLRHLWGASLAFLRGLGWKNDYHGLEINMLPRPPARYPGAAFDMRAGEAQERDGVAAKPGYLKVRVRILEPAGEVPARLEAALRRAGLEVATKATKTSERPSPRSCADVTGRSRLTRLDWIGAGDPEARLLAFVQPVAEAIDAVLGRSS